jgi:hypothetical protein
MTEQTTPEVAPEATAPAGPELTIVDLQNLKAIIDVSAKRGAFSAAEMEAVGTTYNKLSKFLEAVAPAATESADNTPAE